MKSTQTTCHILFLVPSLKGGGAERVMVTLLQHMDRAKFRLSLAVVDMRGAIFEQDVPRDVELIDLNSRRVRSAMPKIFSIIWRRRPDLVFSTLGHLNLALAMLRMLLPSDVRYIAREATIVSELPEVFAIPRWWFWAYRRFYSRLDAVVCQSKVMREDLIRNFGVPSAKAVVIKNPVDIERIRMLASQSADAGTPPVRTGEVRLVAAGSLTAVKGFDLLVEALALCRERSIHLTILGDGALRETLVGLAVQRGLSRRINFAGFKTNPYAYFGQADAVVLSSRFEGCPNVVLESLACGTPVIAIPSPGGVVEMLEGVDGCVLAENCSAEALARALRSFSAGRRISSDAVDSYAVGKIVGLYEKLFLGLHRHPKNA